MKPPQSKNDRLRELLLLDYIKAERSYAHFFKCAWRVLEPTTPLLWNWHHDLICEYLQAIEMGQLRNLVINIAPRSTKSMLVTVCYPVFRWTKKPSHRTLFGSFSDQLATKHSVLRRALIESRWFQTGFGERFRLRDDMNTKAEYANDHTGFHRSGGILSPPMGEGGDEIVIDDPHNTKMAESEADRTRVLQSLDLGWSTRLNNKKTGGIVVVMQRLHNEDYSGHILAKEMGFEHLKIPSICEERTRLIFPISKRELVREQGDYMHPERDGPTELEAAKKQLGPYGFAGQHQQNPVPRSGGVFSDDMFDLVDLPQKFDYRFATCDTAYKDKQENDFTVCSAWGVLGGELYLLDVYRKQIKAAEVEVPIRQFLGRFTVYGFRGAYIEPKGHGIYLNQSLPQGKDLKVGDQMVKFPSIIIPSEKLREEFFSDRRSDKVSRANNAVPNLYGRKVHFGKQISELDTLLTEVLSFPKAKHDDFVDTLIDAVKVVYGRRANILDVL